MPSCNDLVKYHGYDLQNCCRSCHSEMEDDEPYAAYEIEWNDETWYLCCGSMDFVHELKFKVSPAVVTPDKRELCDGCQYRIGCDCLDIDYPDCYADASDKKDKEQRIRQKALSSFSWRLKHNRDNGMCWEDAISKALHDTLDQPTDAQPVKDGE